MPIKRSLRIALTVVAVVVSLALLQLGRRYLQADDTVPLTNAYAVGVNQPPACSPDLLRPRPASAENVGGGRNALTIRLDYAGAEAMLDALERESLSDADVDSLFRIRGVCAMVDNVMRYVPPNGASEFRQEIRSFVRRKRSGKYEPYFQLRGVWHERKNIRGLIAQIRADERRIVDETLSLLEAYRPYMGNDSTPNRSGDGAAISVYFVAGGVSDGFIFESDPLTFYANLARTGGDVNGIISNLAHESYHALQFMAQNRAGIDAVAIASDKAPPGERLLAVTLSEGTANYAIDPTRWTATGPSVEESRERFKRNAEPGRVAEHFARFDKVLKNLHEGRVPWDSAYKEGFTNANEESFYRVGYQMAKAIEQHCGHECIGKLFTRLPVEFFQQYIALYKKHPDIAARFSSETEAIIASYAAKPKG